MNEMENKATESLEEKLENMRKSRDEYKRQAEALRGEVDAKDKVIEKQREQVDKLVGAVCDLSKALKR